MSAPVPYARAKAQRDADNASVLAVMAIKPGSPWTFRDLWAELPALTSDRVRGALTRLTMQGDVQQERGAQANHYHWRLRAPLQEEG